ncbi:GIDE domain-containing protein [Syntrophotalea acetylenica]|uniref:GIDE domain-containing protein n=1 Tax=Syntrophotalea acetylenica TaxID=29542 RepID=UPI002A36F226|nr:GIDE domain-containing protein [Syntrophotalea acetylenica]MDY0261414.1 GIDE domain-containing protein [Syntrophotalea acetylenica]
MSSAEPTYLLIVQSIAADNASLARLRPLLAREYGLDAYILRQRLIGRGPNLIAEGPRQRLSLIAARLAETGIHCRVIEARPPRFVPLRLRALRIQDGELALLTDERSVALGPDHRVLAVLADISGQAAARNLKFLMAQRVYNGRREILPLGDEEFSRAILQGSPILDLYRFGGQGRIDAGVRIFPGRFDPGGLGEQASLSAVGNLKTVLEKIREQVADCRLVLDFGLANLPGCRLKTPEDGLHWERDNLAALTCFGWLMADFETAPAPGGITASAAAPLPETMPQELPEGNAGRLELQPAGDSLPPPPMRNVSNGKNLRLPIGMATAAGFGLLTVIENDLATTCLDWAMRTAVLPAMVTGLCLWGGFHFLRLKRQIENTPTSKTRSLSMGLVELQGRAIRKYALVSPLSQTSCVYYRLRKYRRDSKNNWRLASTSDSGHVPFYLEDDTGRVTIDPRGATVSAGNRQESRGAAAASLFGAFVGSDQEKWVEETVAEGASLFVLGQARENRTPVKPLRERIAMALRELKRDPQALQRYDTNGDGRLSEREWEQARAGIERQVLEQSLSSAPERPAPGDRAVVGRPRKRGIPFVITETTSEKHLLRNYALLTMPLFAGALAGLIWTGLILRNFMQP